MNLIQHSRINSISEGYSSFDYVAIVHLYVVEMATRRVAMPPGCGCGAGVGFGFELIIDGLLRRLEQVV